MVGGPGLEGPGAAAAGLEVVPDPVHRPAGRAGAHRDRQAASTTPSWRSCWRSCTSTGPRSTRAGCSVRAGSAAAWSRSTTPPPRVPAARRRRRHRAVELPGLHPDGLDRVRACGGQRRRLQAKRAHPGGRRLAGQIVRRGRARAAGAPAGHRARADRRATWPSSGVDKIAFTGSTATAKKVMAACAENLTPLVAECGGKDAMIVGADADLDAAADAVRLGRAVATRARPASASSGSTSSRTSTTRSWRS